MLLEKLNDRTKSHHQRIEADLKLLDSGFTLEGYRGLLCRFWGYYSTWEDAVLAFDCSLLDGRSKKSNLISDIQHLEDAPLESLRLARCESLPALDTRARILGSMYVLEGATLGGQILRRHFTAKFNFNGKGCAFFTGYGERTGPMWKQFGETVNAIPPEESDTAVISAIATFESMRAWLCDSALGTE